MNMYMNLRAPGVEHGAQIQMKSNVSVNVKRR